MNASPTPSRSILQTENCRYRAKDTVTLTLLLEIFLKNHKEKHLQTSTATIKELLEKLKLHQHHIDSLSKVPKNPSRGKRKLTTKEDNTILHTQPKNIRLTLDTRFARKYHLQRHCTEVLTANLNENNDKASLLHSTRGDIDLEKSSRNVESQKLREIPGREVRSRRSSFNTNPLSCYSLEQDIEVDSEHRSPCALSEATTFPRKHKFYAFSHEDTFVAANERFHSKYSESSTHLISNPAWNNRVVKNKRHKFGSHLSSSLEENSSLRSPYYRQKVPFLGFQDKGFGDKNSQIQDWTLNHQISSVREKLCALNSNANAASGGRSIGQQDIEDFLRLPTNRRTSVHKNSGITTHVATSNSVAEESDVTAPSEKQCGLRAPESSVATLSESDELKRSDCLQQIHKPSVSPRWRSVRSGNSDIALTKNEANCFRNQVYKAQQSTNPAHIGYRKHKCYPEKSDQSIAAEVRCTCRIATRDKECQLCRSKNNTNSESAPLKLVGIKRNPVWKTVEQNPKSEFEDRLKLFCFAQSRKITADKSRIETLSRNEQEVVRRSFVRNHLSYSNNRSSRSNTERSQREANCCDAFRLLFGNTSTAGEAPLVFSKLLYAAQAASPKRSNLGILTSDQLDMGCFHSVSNKSKVGPCRTNIFSDVQATIDQSPTVIEEYSPIVLRYRTPYFRANAQVIMPPIRRKETWTVGWIQACDYMKFINQYGTLGCSSWEIPALKSGRIPAVSDSDGVSYPWYGNTTEIATIVGPTDSYRRMNLTMNDNFYPSVTWDIPVSEGTNAHLTRIVRDQSFITWLAAVNETTKDIIVLKTVRWNFYLEIDIDPTRELGQRARIVAPRAQKQPLVTNGPGEKNRFQSPVRGRRRGPDNNSNSTYVGQIPISALVRPSANNAQTLIWRPTERQPIVVVPAKEEHRDTNELILFNGCSAMHGKESIIKEISKQEVIQLQQMAR